MTYREFAERHLPPPIRERFIRNIKKQYGKLIKLDQEIYYAEDIDEEEYQPTGFYAIDNAFGWYLTPEGDVYWGDIADCLEDIPI